MCIIYHYLRYEHDFHSPSFEIIVVLLLACCILRYGWFRSKYANWSTLWKGGDGWGRWWYRYRLVGPSRRWYMAATHPRQAWLTHRWARCAAASLCSLPPCRRYQTMYTFQYLVLSCCTYFPVIFSVSRIRVFTSTDYNFCVMVCLLFLVLFWGNTRGRSPL